MVQVPFHKLEIPTGKDVCRKQFFHFMDKLLSADISHGDYETYVPMLEEKFADVSKEEVLKRVAAKEFSRFLKYYENAEDLNVRAVQTRPGGSGTRAKGTNPYWWQPQGTFTSCVQFFAGQWRFCETCL